MPNPPIPPVPDEPSQTDSTNTQSGGKDANGVSRKSSLWITAEERAHQRSAKREKMLEKVSGKVVGFMRLSVTVGTSVLTVTIDKRKTVQDLIDLVTAEYMFTKAAEEVGTQDKAKFLEAVEKAQPIVVTQVYNSGMLALSFESVIQDVLEFNDSVTVAYMDEVTLGIIPNSRENSIYDNAAPPVPSTRPNTINFDDSLKSLLSNTIALSHLQQFSLEEYTLENLLLHLDIEALQTCNEDTVIDYCKYIYNMYFSTGAPIPVIISSDMRKDIVTKIDCIDELDVTVYDAVQEQVLATLQTFLLPRFMKSQLFTKLSDERMKEPSNFLTHQITSFTKTYPNDMKQIKKLTEILTNPLSPTTPVLLASLNNNTPVAQEDLREFLLSKTARRFSPAIPASSFSGYFDNNVRKRWAVKQRRIVKEKKLNKFFGQRVGEDEMKMQKIGADAAVIHDGIVEIASVAGGAGHGGITAVKITDILKAIEDLDNDEGGGGDGVTRRKKIEKLRNIFGDQIPTLNKTGSTKSSSESLKKEKLAQEEPVVETTNDLSKDERRFLNKRNQKLTGMLGEAVDAKLVGVNEVKGGQSSGTTPSLPRSRKSQAGAPVLGSVEPPTPMSSVMAPEPASPKRILQPEFSSMDSAELLKTDDDDDDDGLNGLLGDEATVSKEARKKRIDKLSKVFGQRIQSHIVMAEANKNLKLMTFAQKVDVRRKCSKIEARMGSNMSPAEKASMAMKIKKSVEEDILKQLQKEDDELGKDASPPPDEAGDRLFQFISNLGLMTQNTIEVDEFLDLVSVIAAEITGKGNQSNDSDMDPDYIQATKEKRIAKLKKFFKISAVTIYDYIDTQIIRVLEAQIRILVTDQAEIDVLKEEILTLRGILNGRSPDFQGQISGLRMPSFSATSNRSSAAHRGSDAYSRLSGDAAIPRSGSNSQTNSMISNDEPEKSVLSPKASRAFAKLSSLGLNGPK